MPRSKVTDFISFLLIMDQNLTKMEWILWFPSFISSSVVQLNIFNLKSLFFHDFFHPYVQLLPTSIPFQFCSYFFILLNVLIWMSVVYASHCPGVGTEQVTSCCFGFTWCLLFLETPNFVRIEPTRNQILWGVFSTEVCCVH